MHVEERKQRMEYRHGGDIYGREILWDFSVNLNPLGMPESGKEALRSYADSCARYPDSRCRRLVKLLSRYYQVHEEEILCGNGAADMIYRLAFADRPKRGFLPSPTFSEYGRALKAAGAELEFFPLEKEEGFCIDPDRLADFLEKRQAGPGDMLFLCNPNNPTGQALSKEPLAGLAAFSEERGIRLVADECFLAFLEEPFRCSMVPYLEDFPHMAVIDALTKSCAMAGLRLGWCMSADTALLERIKRISQPWPVSGAAQAAGEAVLEEMLNDPGYFLSARRIIKEGRSQLEEALKSLGFWACPSQANYILFQDGRKEGADGRLFLKCLERKLLIRSCRYDQGLDKSFYRVCVKTKEENRILIRLLGELCEGN